MTAAITVLYPDVDDASFDLDYYLATHMPLVMKLMGPRGMSGWRVARVVGTPTGGRAPYSIVATLDFAAAEVSGRGSRPTGTPSSATCRTSATRIP